MLEGGYIKLHRQITKWGWYTDEKTKSVFIHLLLTANYEEHEFLGETIKPGERVASYATLALELGFSIQNVRTAIKHLKLTNEITSRTNHQYTVFTIVNYAMYQSEQQTSNKRLTNAQQTPNNNGRKNKERIKERIKKESAFGGTEFHINEGGDF